MNNEEREIDVKLLLAYVFKKWRTILNVTIICSFLMVIYYGIKTLPSYKSMQNTYNQGLVNYEASKTTLSDNLKKTQNYIDYLTNYTKNSIKANIDPYNEVRTIITISTVTKTGQDDFQALLSGTNHANQITQAYASFINYSINYSQILESLNIDEKNLKEVVNASVNYDNDMVTLIVIGNSVTQTEAISKFILSQVMEYVDIVKSKYGDHSAVFSDLLTNTVTDSGLLTAVTDKMLSPNSAMNDALTKIDTLKTSLSTQQKSIDSLQKPSTVFSIVIHGIVKNMILGICVGFFGIFILLSFIVLMSGKILSESDLSRGFHLTVLGIFPMKYKNKHKHKFDIFIHRIIDSSCDTNTEIVLEKIIINLKANAENCKSLLLISVKTKIDVSVLQNELQSIDNSKIYISTADVNLNARELNKINKVDAIIIVAKRNVTKINDVCKVIDTVNNCNRQIIGSILL